MAISQYERQKAANIERNRLLLQELGLDKPLIEPKEQRRKKDNSKSMTTKRKLENEQEDENENAPARAKRVVEIDSGGLRRSARNAGKSIDYKAEKQLNREPTLVAYSSGVKFTANQGPLGREAGSKRLNNPKEFGAIPGVQVGTWWETRQGCSADAIHAPWVGGIHPSEHGAFSVALSGGYEDDIDLGYAFTYTGSGGRDLKGTKDSPKNLRTAPQSSDQDFDNRHNKALKRSCETGKPVRVVRGFKLKSAYAPSEGYRYDGLYKVEKAWRDQGLEGYLVCKFAFKRLANQPPLPVRSLEGDETPEDQEDDEADANESNE